MSDDFGRPISLEFGGCVVVVVVATAAKTRLMSEMDTNKAKEEVGFSHFCIHYAITMQ